MIKQVIAYSSLLVFLISLQVVYLFKGLHNDCFHATDFSIYQQAIYDISFQNLNPFLTVRNIKIFNDHFDPIIYSALIFTKVFGKNPYNLIIIELIWVFMAFGLLLNRRYSLENNLKIVLLFIFSKGIWSALHFPIHPSTWALFPILLLFKNIYNNKSDFTIVLSCIFLFLFKEIFSFATMFLAFSFYYQKRRFLSIKVFVTSLIWAVLTFKIIPLLIGENYPHGGKLFSSFINSPLETFLGIDFFASTKLLLPFLFPMFLLLDKKLKHPLTINSLAFAFPLLTLHVVANKTGFHYGAFLCAPFIAAIVFNKEFESKLLTNKKNYLIVLSLFFLTGMGKYTKALNLVLLNKSNKCDLSKAAQQARTQLRSVLKTIDFKQESIISGGAHIPLLYTEGGKFYQVALFNDPKIKKYDYVLLTLGKTGNTYPLSRAEIDEIIRKCHFENILIHDDYHFLGQGLKDTGCLPPSKQN